MTFQPSVAKSTCKGPAMHATERRTCGEGPAKHTGKAIASVPASVLRRNAGLWDPFRDKVRQAADCTPQGVTGNLQFGRTVHGAQSLEILSNPLTPGLQARSFEWCARALRTQSRRLSHSWQVTPCQNGENGLNGLNGLIGS